MMKVTSENFAQEVLASEVPVLVDFFAEWCMPCKMFAPILEDLTGDYEGKLKIVKVNVDEVPKLAQKYRVMSIPTIKLFAKEEEPKASFTGAMSREELEDWLASYGVE